MKLLFFCPPLLHEYMCCSMLKKLSASKWSSTKYCCLFLYLTMSHIISVAVRFLVVSFLYLPDTMSWFIWSKLDHQNLSLIFCFKNICTKSSNIETLCPLHQSKKHNSQSNLANANGIAMIYNPHHTSLSEKSCLI